MLGFYRLSRLHRNSETTDVSKARLHVTAFVKFPNPIEPIATHFRRIGVATF